MFLWIFLNAVHFVFDFDPFPFIFLNLFMSAEAAFSTPIIMMSQNRASARDRHQANADYVTNLKAKREIELLITKLDTLEIEKLDKILNILVGAEMEARAKKPATKKTR